MKFGNPLGPSPVKLVRRNHKKLALVDDRVAYLGGINFSEHNFEWHDMMIRVESSDLGAVLGEDFHASWAGEPSAFDVSVGPVRLISLNGRGNSRFAEPVFQAIANARRSIDVVSAYLTHPFTRHLADARERGVRVRVLTPAKNNKRNLERHILQRAHQDDFEVFKYAGGMNHMKAILVDEEMLVVGSSNFDFMSYHILEEFIVMTRDRALIDSYLERIWLPDLALAHRAPLTPTVGTRYGDAAVHVGAALADALALP